MHLIQCTHRSAPCVWTVIHHPALRFEPLHGTERINGPFWSRHRRNCRCHCQLASSRRQPRDYQRMSPTRTDVHRMPTMFFTPPLPPTTRFLQTLSLWRSLLQVDVTSAQRMRSSVHAHSHARPSSRQHLRSVRSQPSQTPRWSFLSHRRTWMRIPCLRSRLSSGGLSTTPWPETSAYRFWCKPPLPAHSRLQIQSTLFRRANFHICQRLCPASFPRFVGWAEGWEGRR